MTHPLGDFANCEWCGKEHAIVKNGTAIGYVIAGEYFTEDGGEGLANWLHDNYLCKDCAEIAANAYEMRKLVKNVYDNMQRTRSDGIWFQNFKPHMLEILRAALMLDREEPHD